MPRKPPRHGQIGHECNPYGHNRIGEATGVWAKCKMASHLAYHAPYDLSIHIERHGGGAQPLGFIALADGDNDEILAEDWTEEGCFARIFGYLIDGEHHPSFQCNTLPDFPTFSIHRPEAFVFAEPWQRAAVMHDIFDCCLAIDTGALEH